MSVSGDPQDAPRRSVFARLRAYFFTGLVIAAPLVLTLYITWSLIIWIDSWVTPFIPARYSPDTYLPFPVPGFGLVFAVVCLTVLGFLTANLVGRKLVAFGESLVGRMPIVRTLYGGLKQIFETVLSSKAKSFQTVGLIEYPRKGLWAIVFVATDARGEVLHHLAEKEDEEDIVGVFLPTTPNPTSGFLLYLKKSDIIYLEMTVEQAAKLVISAGLVTPDFGSGGKLPDEQLENLRAKRRATLPAAVNPTSTA